jgi:triphosphoribosyl-dephospho-CoA synthase
VGSAAEIFARAQLACLLEVAAPKPGNVRPGAGFGDVGFEHYLASAVALGPALAAPAERRVGAMVLEGVRATRRYVSTNTNLGILLLLAPLARAAARRGLELRDGLREVLEELSVDDARDAYAAIREAEPGGLGRVADQDVRGRPDVTLREAMALAADRDSIAREYVTDFEITFERMAPGLRQARGALDDWPRAIVQAYLEVLEEIPDTLIARKLGQAAAEDVSRAAGKVVAAGGMHSESGRRAATELDRELRDPDNRRNPGTTADLVAAGLFVVLTDWKGPL